MDKTALYDFVNNNFSDTKILLLGDMMLDKYYYGEVTRISPEAPVPITRVISQKETLGGAANVAANAALLGAKVSAVGFIGKDAHGESLKVKFKELNMDTAGLIDTNSPTTTKIRIIGAHQQMLRLDFEDVVPPSKDSLDKIKAYIASELPNADALIISDYAKGLITEDISRFAINAANENGIPAVVDPKGIEWKKYANASFITPNFKEIQAVMPEIIENTDEDVVRAAHHVMKEFALNNVIVTRSSKGMTLVSSDTANHIRAKAREVYDVSGAGDTVIATFSIAVGGGLAPSDAAYLSNIAASVVVGKLGTYAISKNELTDALK